MLIAQIGFALPCCREHHIVFIVPQALDQGNAEALEHIELDFLTIVFREVVEQKRKIVALHGEHRADVDRARRACR